MADYLRGRSKLRVRYATPHNFVIAADGSPINDGSFDEILVEHFERAAFEQ